MNAEPRPHPRAILVDAGGVLLMPDLEAQALALAAAGVACDPADLDRGHYLGVLAWDALGPTAPEEGWRAYATAVARGAGVVPEALSVATEALLAAFASTTIWHRPRPGSVSGLAAIAASGRPIVVVSNSDGTVEAALRAEAICQVGPGAGVDVAAVLDSSVVGSAKPDHRIFELALEAAGVQPAEAVHIGDSTWADVAGARGAGIAPLHFDPHRVCPALDHDHVRSLAELATIPLPA